MISYYYTPRNDGSTKASSIKIYNNLESPITPLIEFIVDGSIPIDKYTFHPYTPSNYRVFNLNGKYIVQFRVNVPAKTSYYITLTSINDTIPPKIYTNIVRDLNELKLHINVTDEYVGVRNVGLRYQYIFANGSRSKWYSVDDITPKIIVNRDLTLFSYDLLNYEYKLPVPNDVLNVTYSIIAEDFMGNLNYVNGSFTFGVPKYYTLTIDSSPLSGIQFTMAGSSYTTKFSGLLKSDNYTVSFPVEVTVGGVKYVFNGWSDGFSNPTRTISLNSDISLTVYYRAESPTQVSYTWIYVAMIIMAIVVIVIVLLRRR